MSAIEEIAKKIAEKHQLPIKFILDLFELERDRISQLRRRSITSDIRDLLQQDYWKEVDSQ
jgi:hypothetical protein